LTAKITKSTKITPGSDISAVFFVICAILVVEFSVEYFSAR